MNKKGKKYGFLLAATLLLLVVTIVTVVYRNTKPDNQSEASGNSHSEAETETEPDSQMADGDGPRIGVILIGDETEAYTRAHIEGICTAASALGIPEDAIMWKERVAETKECFDAAEELVKAGCELVISTSRGYQDDMKKAAEEYPEVDFVVIAGEYAAVSGLDNYYNAYTDIYEARYVAGVVAGLKIRQLHEDGELLPENYNDDGDVKVGYIGTFPEAEVVSGYTAFYLGIQSVFPNVVMDVQYTKQRLDIDSEATAANEFIRSGCVIIGQHSGSAAAASAVEEAWQKGRCVYVVGSDESVLASAGNAGLTSVQSVWSVYYEELFRAMNDGTDIPQDWSEGYDCHAVALTELGPNIAEGTTRKVEKIQNALKDDSIYVFDLSTFTVAGNEVTEETAMISLSYKDADGQVLYQGDTQTALVCDANGIVRFEESMLRAAPYFFLKIDGITEQNVDSDGI